MKKLLLTLGFIATLTSCVSTKSFNFKPYEKVALNKNDKNDNYILANEFVVEAFNNAKSVIQFQDKENGIVKGKYQMSSGSAIVTVRVKDGAAKITIDTGDLTFLRKNKKDDALALAKFKTELNLMTNAFINYMENTNNNW